MSGQPEQPLHQALCLTRKLLGRIHEGEIAQAVELEAERTRLIRQGVAEESPENLRERVDILREIQALDEQIAASGRKSQQEIARQLRQLHQGRKAGMAYQGA